MWEKLVSALGVQLAKELLSQAKKWLMALIDRISERISNAKRAEAQEEAQKNLDQAIEKDKQEQTDESKAARRKAFEDSVNSGS